MNNDETILEKIEDVVAPKPPVIAEDTNAGAIGEHIQVLVRQLALVIGGGVTFYHLVLQRDVVGATTFLSTQTAEILAAIAMIAAFAIGQWKTWKSRLKLVFAEHFVSDRIITLKSKVLALRGTGDGLAK